MQYYDPERDRPVEGLYFSAERLALIRALTYREPYTQDLVLSPEGLAGLCGLVTMIQQCVGFPISLLETGWITGSPPVFQLRRILWVFSGAQVRREKNPLRNSGCLTLCIGLYMRDFHSPRRFPMVSFLSF